jgi:hypothetical protein
MARYGNRDIVDVVLRDIETKVPVVSLDYLKTASQTLGSEIVYQQGGRGAPKLVGFQSENSLRMEITSALFTPQLLALLFGTEVEEGVKNIAITEKLTKSNTETLTLKDTPVIDEDHPIFIQPSSDGTTPGEPVDAYDYDINQKVITLLDSDEDHYLVTYYKATSSSNKRVSFDTDKFTRAYELVGYTEWKNADNKRLYACHITIPALQLEIDGATLESVMNGDPTDLVINGEALETPGSKSLIIYDIDEGSPID